MMATSSEIESFVSKFRYLCSAGFKASLKLNCEDGHAFISFDVNLDHYHHHYSYLRQYLPFKDENHIVIIDA